jgi:hypothetical protein
LRQKLQKHSANWRYIHTHFGIGYRFDPEPVGGVKEERVELPEAGTEASERTLAELAPETH